MLYGMQDAVTTSQLIPPKVTWNNNVSNLLWGRSKTKRRNEEIGNKKRKWRNDRKWRSIVDTAGQHKDTHLRTIISRYASLVAWTMKARTIPWICWFLVQREGLFQTWQQVPSFLVKRPTLTITWKYLVLKQLSDHTFQGPELVIPQAKSDWQPVRRRVACHLF